MIIHAMLIAAGLATTPARAVFKELTSLAGKWEGTQDGTPVKVTYTLMANGSALMEEMKPGNESAMITMFTVDGDRLIATHYCSARNQPQMITRSIGDLDKGGVTFALARVTGLETPDDWHNTGLTFIRNDANHITQHWTWAYKGKTGTSTFRYTRRTSDGNTPK